MFILSTHYTGLQRIRQDGTAQYISCYHMGKVRLTGLLLFIDASYLISYYIIISITVNCFYFNCIVILLYCQFSLDVLDKLPSQHIAFHCIYLSHGNA